MQKLDKIQRQAQKLKERMKKQYEENAKEYRDVTLKMMIFLDEVQEG